MKRIYKNTTITLIIVVILLTGCKRNTDIQQLMQNTPQIIENTTPNQTEDYYMPALPDLDFSDMDFFEDGYELVEYISIADGDTADFLVDDVSQTTRFLAIDTPEINSTKTGLEPWAIAAKEFAEEKLKNAKSIILELDEQSDIYDSYDRLLVWVWVDGELLNYMLVEEGLAYVKYLYGDYRYTDAFLALESSVREQKIKIWGELDPDYDYNNETIRADISTIRNIQKGKNVIATGVVTNTIGKNAFIQDETGAIYIYANKQDYTALKKGNKVQLEGTVVEYNGLLEISNIADDKIAVLEEGIEIPPKIITLDMISENLEGQYIKLENLTVTDVISVEGKKGYNVYVTDGKSDGVIRVDKYLDPYPEPSEFIVGETLDLIGNIGQYKDMYQIMIGSKDDVYK